MSSVLPEADECDHDWEQGDAIGDPEWIDLPGLGGAAEEDRAREGRAQFRTLYEFICSKCCDTKVEEVDE